MPTPITYDIDIHSDIGWGFSKHDARRGLQAAGNRPVRVRVSSFGGSLADGLDIRRQFVEHGDVELHIAGMTASSATVLAMGARRIFMSRGASLLIHNCSLWTLSWGQKNKEEIAEEVERLKAIHGDLATLDEVMATIYAARTRRPKSEMLDLMKANRWLSAQEALDFGLVDELEDDLVDGSSGASASVLSRISALGFPDLPSSPEASSSCVDLPAGSSSSEAPPARVGTAVSRAFSVLRDFFTSADASFSSAASSPALPTSQTFISMDKTTFPALLAALEVETLQASADGSLTLSAAQLQRLESTLASASSPSEPASSPSEPASDAPAPDSSSSLSDELAALRAKVEALEGADGAETVRVTDPAEDVSSSSPHDSAAQFYDRISELL